MNLYRFEQLRQAQRLLELAEVMAENGDHFAAAGKVFEARRLIFAEGPDERVRHANSTSSPRRMNVMAETIAQRHGEAMRALRYLMQQFDSETWQCPRCGHAEDTATMDSAIWLREWLELYNA